MSRQIEYARYMALETFRRDGTGVPTPVWFAPDSSNKAILYVFSKAEAGKVKRLRLSPKVRVAPCSVSGKRLGNWLAGHGYLVSDPFEIQRAYGALYKKYGWQIRGVDFISRLFGRYRQRQMLRVELDQERNSPFT